MTDDDLDEARVREIVREELRPADGTSRRQLLGALGLGGLAGLGGRSGGGTGTPTSSGGGAGVPASTGGVLPDGTYVARRGDLQSALADAAEDGVGRVRLVSGATYRRGEPIEVPEGVVLDCAGARIDLGADVDGFRLHRRSRVRSPQVRTAGVDGYSSSVFHVWPERFREDVGAPMPTWTVFGGWTEMTPGEGTCIDLHGGESAHGAEYDPEYEWNVYFCHVAHNCVGGRRFAHLRREGGAARFGGHVNGNLVQGFAHGATTFVETDDDAGGADNMVNGNTFLLATQPHDASEWLWYANKGINNELRVWGQHWDYHQYSDADGDGNEDWWYIGPEAGPNFLWRNRMGANGGLGSAVVDDSDGDSGSRYLVHERMGTPVGDLPVHDGAE